MCVYVCKMQLMKTINTIQIAQVQIITHDASLGLSYKSIIWTQKREKSLGFFCVVKGILGQRYYESPAGYWPDLVPIYWLYKRPMRKDHGRYWLKRKKGVSELHLLAELHCCGESIGYCE